MSAEGNKAVVRRYLEFINSMNKDQLPPIKKWQSFFAPDYIYHNPLSPESCLSTVMTAELRADKIQGRITSRARCESPSRPTTGNLREDHPHASV